MKYDDFNINEKLGPVPKLHEFRTLPDGGYGEDGLGSNYVINVYSPTEREADNVYEDTVENVNDSQEPLNLHRVGSIAPEFDPWALPELTGDDDDKKKWKDLTASEKVKLILFNYIGKFLLFLILLYTFVCSLDILSSAFRLLGGKTTGAVFQNSQLLDNPVAGLMIGVLATVLVQSSSTSTSIVVSMVASEILTVPTAIPIIMGANIGTSMTNTLVSVAHSTDRAEFRRAFAGATVHDMFNWLTVIVLLPLEVATGYLYITTSAIVNSMNLNANHTSPPQLLTVLTEPLTHRIIQLDKSKLEKLASGMIKDDENFSLIKKFCGPKNADIFGIENGTLLDVNNTSLLTGSNATVTDVKCKHIFAYVDLSDTVAGIILLVVSLGLLILCLICIVKLLHSVLRGQVASVIRKTVNADLPGCWSFLTGYLAILIGAIMTILVQSSSVFTSALTPLVGIGVLDVARMYPLTLGSNIGTTFTSVLAAMASPGRTMASALQIALCHLFFNLSGIVLFFPIPFMRQLPISAAKALGEITAAYRWFAIVYVLLSFFVLPAVIFGLSAWGTVAMMSFGIPILSLLIIIIIINVTQKKRPKWLPKMLRSWSFLPLCLRSLEPADRVVQYGVKKCKIICPCCCKVPEVDLTVTCGRNLPPSESRRKLLIQASADNSRATSRVGSPKSSSAKLTLLLLDDNQNRVKNDNKLSLLP